MKSLGGGNTLLIVSCLAPPPLTPVRSTKQGPGISRPLIYDASWVAVATQLALLPPWLFSHFDVLSSGCGPAKMKWVAGGRP